MSGCQVTAAVRTRVSEAVTVFVCMCHTESLDNITILSAQFLQLWSALPSQR